MKLKCGPNGQKFNGLEMETETLGFFIAKLLKGDDIIILRGYTIEREDGAGSEKHGGNGGGFLSRVIYFLQSEQF